MLIKVLQGYVSHEGSLYGKTSGEVDIPEAFAAHLIESGVAEQVEADDPIEVDAAEHAEISEEPEQGGETLPPPPAKDLKKKKAPKK